jgi:short subunit dehydrogenase-like uncharacterized protein
MSPLDFRASETDTEVPSQAAERALTATLLPARQTCTRAKPIVYAAGRVYSGLMQLDSTGNDRQYDIVVGGASGFTGQLVVEYLAHNYPVGAPVRWAIAGRNREKLHRVLAEYCTTGATPAVLIVDSHDGNALRRLARDTRVVLTTVGPYARYGSELVAACVENGTHYCDLAGEPQWIRQMIDQQHSAARKSGAIIVPSCGFDSIPSDIGVFYLQQQAVAQFGQICNEVTLLVRAIKGGASGGTFASMLNAIEQAQNDRRIARILADPYSLNPDGERNGPDGGDQKGMRYNARAGVWTAPFVMAAVNTRIVRRSNALLDYRYGRDFRYSEATSTGRGLVGWWRSAVMTGGLACFLLACTYDVTRSNIVKRLIPAPGQGPSRQQRERGYFDLRLFGRTASGKILQARVTGDRDPGYGSTSKMLAESALCLAGDPLEVAGGFWTPATAMGQPLMERLISNSGLTFELVS